MRAKKMFGDDEEYFAEPKPVDKDIVQPGNAERKAQGSREDRQKDSSRVEDLVVSQSRWMTTFGASGITT